MGLVKGLTRFEFQFGVSILLNHNLMVSIYYKIHILWIGPDHWAWYQFLSNNILIINWKGREISPIWVSVKGSTLNNSIKTWPRI